MVRYLSTKKKRGGPTLRNFIRGEVLLLVKNTFLIENNLQVITYIQRIKWNLQMNVQQLITNTDFLDFISTTTLHQSVKCPVVSANVIVALRRLLKSNFPSPFPLSCHVSLPPTWYTVFVRCHFLRWQWLTHLTSVAWHRRFSDWSTLLPVIWCKAAVKTRYRVVFIWASCQSASRMVLIANEAQRQHSEKLST